MHQQVEKLLKSPQYKQKSEEWFKAREFIITASSAAVLLNKTEDICKEYVNQFCLQKSFEYNGKCCNPYANQDEYIKEKSGQIKSEFKGNIATFWGNKYEQIACDIYSLLTNQNILEFGLLIHNTINWIGASPDGISENGTMLEIKCPFRRNITGIPPLYYWIQVQLQLEVCDLEYCDFFECEFREYLTFDEFIDDSIEELPILYKGIIIKNGDNEYIYPDKNNINNVLKIQELSKEYISSDIIYWKLIKYSNTKIKRSREWFKNVKPILEEKWNTILHLKKNNLTV